MEKESTVVWLRILESMVCAEGRKYLENGFNRSRMRSATPDEGGPPI